MIKRTARFQSVLLSLFALAIVWSLPAYAADTRAISTTDNADYYGFDLRSEKDLTLDQCKSTCLGDNQCRAFTYNTKAKWCFLKSDFRQLIASEGAVAGKIVKPVGAPDIGAAPKLSFVADNLTEEARRFRTEVAATPIDENVGLQALNDGADAALRNGDPRAAMQMLTAALNIASDDSGMWSALARSILDVEPANNSEKYQLQRNANSAAVIGYDLSRSTQTRADALAVLAAALDRRELYRPALQAYEASLQLVNSAGIRATYEDLKARKGFRIIDHSIDNDSASPRICAQFSEDLVKSGIDYSPFIKLDDQTPKAIEAKGRQICVEGLQHGQTYRLTFRSGLPAAIGEVLAAPVTLSVYVQDRSPSVRFTGESFVLPSTARRGIPLVSINTAAADVKLYRVGDRALAQFLTGQQFLRKLDDYDISTITEQSGQALWQGQIEIAQNELNKEVTTSFPIDEALPQRKPGVYIMTAQPLNDRSESYDARATQWFVVSDIGLSTYTGEDGINVFARSLASAKPIAGVNLTLLARNNEVLGTALTDADGRATFTPGLARGEGGMLPAVLMAEGVTDQVNPDFVFLDMSRAGFDLSDRGVAGRATPGALDIYAWTERGIYRVGEEVHVAALARDDRAQAVENLPLTFIFTRPDGVEDRRILADGEKAGGYAVDLTLSANAMRGTWNVAIHTDPKQPAVATQMFLVEDFVPDRIEFDLTSDRDEIAVGDSTNINVDGRFLYGAPAAGLSIEGEITLSTKRDWDRFKGYVFGLADEQEGDATRIALDDLPNLDNAGKASFPVIADELPSTTRLINAAVTVRMRESGGRAVERSINLAIRPQGDMIGIKPDFSGNEVAQGGTAKFSLIATSADGARKTLTNANWSLVKIERNYQWYRSGNSWNYEPVTFTKAVANGKADLTSDQEASLSLPVDWGRYRLEIAANDPSGPASSYEFDAGWFVEASSTETPDGLEIALDKAEYAKGETAKLQISPRFAGELLVTVGADRLLKTFTAQVPESGATIDLPIGDDWGAGVYVTATLYRPGDALETRMPARAIGLKWLKINPADRKLNITLSPAEKTLPRGPLAIPVSVQGANPASDTYVMVAAVDVGILNLTRYTPPNPEEWFYGQRQLGLELRDLYGRLIDGSLGVTGKLRTGGDGANMAAQGSPPTEKLVALFSGPVKLDSDGKALIEFDLPQFNGTVRIMAVAWTRQAVGHAVQDVIVRDPVVITAGLPRFMAPGDMATMRLDIANTDAPDGNYRLSIESTDNLGVEIGSFPEQVALVASKRQSLSVPISATQTGAGSVTIRLTGDNGTGDNGIAVEQTLFVPVRPVDLPITTRYLVDLKANGDSLRVDEALLSASLLDGAYVSVGISAGAGFDVPSLLMTLDRYPFGCAEQTTSRALPLLYLNELAAQNGMEIDPDVAKRIQDAIYQVLNNQSSSGSFGLWGPGSGDLWLDAYVSDFLTRAREKNFDVPSQAMMQALSNLQNSISYDVDIKDRGSEIAYALYVLARNKKASIGDLRYYADSQIDNFASPMAIAQLAASLALYGDQQRSEMTFSAALARAKTNTAQDYARADYGSPLRDDAALLALAAETRPASKIVPELIKLVTADRQAANYLSTQDQAWMLMAARALKDNNDAVKLTINGASHIGAYSERINGNQLADNPLVIANTSDEPVQAVVTALAAPAQSLPAGGDGFSIERSYYTLDGSPANITSIDQNERFVVVLKIEQSHDWASRILVQDLLPAGFEIDNPGLVSSADLASFSWLESTEAAHLEFRNDRFVAAFDRGLGDNKPITLAYVVRAVTPGLYTHPAASVDDMYRPQYAARTATGMMEVNAP